MEFGTQFNFNKLERGIYIYTPKVDKNDHGKQKK